MAQAAAVTKSSQNVVRFLARHAALKAVLLSAVMSAVLVARNTNDGPAWRVSLVLAAGIGLATWLVFGLAIPRVTRRQSANAPARWTMVMAVVTVLSVAVFWTALTPIFALGAFALAVDAQERSTPAPRCARLGVAIAGLGLAASLVLALVG